MKLTSLYVLQPLPPPTALIQSSPWRHFLSVFFTGQELSLTYNSAQESIKILDFFPQESCLGKNIENRLTPGLSHLFLLLFKRK